MSAGEFKETVPIAVELGFKNAQVRSVELALPKELAPKPPRVLDHIAEFLAQDRKFLPAKDVASNAWFLFQQDHLLWIRMRTTGDEELQGYDEASKPFHVTFDLADGSRIEGTIVVSAVQPNPRPLDYMNQVDELVPLYATDFLWLIQRNAIERVWDPKSWDDDSESTVVDFDAPELG